MKNKCPHCYKKSIHLFKAVTAYKHNTATCEKCGGKAYVSRKLSTSIEVIGAAGYFIYALNVEKVDEKQFLVFLFIYFALIFLAHIYEGFVNGFIKA